MFDVICEIRKVALAVHMFQDGSSQRNVAAAFGVSQSVVFLIMKSLANYCWIC